jgi:hypothetical protein
MKVTATLAPMDTTALAAAAGDTAGAEPAESTRPTAAER